MKEYKIHLLGGSDGETATVVTDHRDDSCLITLSYRGRSIEASAHDYFEAFCQIRLELEKERLIPFCYGASLDVYPSGMCRDMGAGMAAYRLTPGKHTKRSDLIGIFEDGPDVTPCYVSVQRAYYNDWLKQEKT